ncbi:MAG: DUF1002 domain-containing protein [bacterium]|nr:DUF1002 domain-containing protein [bacterium]
MRKKLITMALGLTLAFSAQTMVVKADSATVVTIGANLNDEQKAKIFEYFGVKEDSVEVLTVTNKDEREYLEGVASEAQIGKRTYSCAYIEPTNEGNGINIKTANLSWVTPYMIKSTLTTAGIYDCNVLAAAPFKVSGTGALTGIMKAFESVTGETLDEEKKELATEELVMTGDLAEEIGSDQATGIITDVKDSVISQNIVNADKIEQIIIDSSTTYNVSLTSEQVDAIAGMMERLAKQDYDYDRLADTFQSIKDSTAEKLGIELDTDGSGIIESIKKFFTNLFNWFKGLFADSEDTEQPSTDLGILDTTNDEVWGEDVIIDSTEESVVPSASPTVEPTAEPTLEPTLSPTEEPSTKPTEDADQMPETEDETPMATEDTPSEEVQ